MEENKNYISKYCVVENNIVFLNGNKKFEEAGVSFPTFIKSAYRNLAIDYPKFFKMDNLSKLAFLAAEIVLKEGSNSNEINDIALVFANQQSSLDTDEKYQLSITNKEAYFPSPAVFVYTLPNICIGEISIKHQLKTENCFFVFDTFNAEFMTNYATQLLKTNKAGKVLCGWVEYHKETYKAVLYIVEKQGELVHNQLSVNNIYNN